MIDIRNKLRDLRQQRGHLGQQRRDQRQQRRRYPRQCHSQVVADHQGRPDRRHGCWCCFTGGRRSAGDYIANAYGKWGTIGVLPTTLPGAAW